MSHIAINHAYPEWRVVLGLPDRGYFSHVSSYTTTPIRAIWLCTIVSILPGLLDFASPIAANAIFSLTAMALDLSYIIPIFLWVVYVHIIRNLLILFKASRLRTSPWSSIQAWSILYGPRAVGLVSKCYLHSKSSLSCLWLSSNEIQTWTVFICVIFSIPTVRPVTAENMNYASVYSLYNLAFLALNNFIGYYSWSHRSLLVSLQQVLIHNF